MKRTGIWRFSGPLRITALITAAFYSLVYVIMWASAWLGHTAMVFDYAEVDVDLVVNAPLTPLQLIGGMFSTGLFIGSMLLIALTANRFLRIAYREGFFEAGVARTLKHLGRGLVLFYLGLFLDNFSPWLITKNLPPELQKEFNLMVLDPTLVALIAGFVLLLLSTAMNEAREIDTDNKQFI